MTSDSQVLIVGAGPTGLTLAAHLLGLGMGVRLVDQKLGPSTTSKAIGLQYRVSEILACMGVVDRFLARGGTRLRSTSMPVIADLFSSVSKARDLKVAVVHSSLARS